MGLGKDASMKWGSSLLGADTWVLQLSIHNEWEERNCYLKCYGLLFNSTLAMYVTLYAHSNCKSKINTTSAERKKVFAPLDLFIITRALPFSCVLQSALLLPWHQFILYCGTMWSILEALLANSKIHFPWSQHLASYLHCKTAEQRKMPCKPIGRSRSSLLPLFFFGWFC